MLNIYIYLNNDCSLNCNECNKYFQQTPFCTKDNEIELENNLLEKIIKQIPASVLKVHFLGGNIFSYSGLDFLLNLLKIDNKHSSVFYVYYLNVVQYKIEKLDYHQVEILFNFPICNEWFDNNKSLFSKDNIKFKFLIISEEEYNNAAHIISKYKIGEYIIQPFYNGENEKFFSENVYLNEEDILAKEENKQRYIFAHQKVNTNHFGTLYLFPNGDVRANNLTNVVGNIKKDVLTDIVRKELFENTAWRKIRNEAPCNNCLCQFLCPSPANYERVIGKINLCHLKWINFQNISN